MGNPERPEMIAHSTDPFPQHPMSFCSRAIMILLLGTVCQLCYADEELMDNADKEFDGLRNSTISRADFLRSAQAFCKRTPMAAGVAEITALQGTVQKAASTRRAPLTNGLFHVGFENAEYWNEDLWTRLSASGVNCNPAKCANPAVCAIPNCTLVDFHKWYWGVRRWNRFDCDTSAKQMSTCIPRRMKHAWPASVGLDDGEDEACRVALGKRDTRMGQILFTWYLHPATRTVFCQSNYYVNFYVIAAPSEQPKKKMKMNNYDWIFMNPGFRNAGDWMVSVRGFFAFPFGTWKLGNEQSTRNIVLFIFKRSVCKGSKCFNTKDAKCFETRKNFTRKRYPSAVSSSELRTAQRQIKRGRSKKCSKATLKYAMPTIEKFVAAS